MKKLMLIFVSCILFACSNKTEAVKNESSLAGNTPPVETPREEIVPEVENLDGIYISADNWGGGDTIKIRKAAESDWYVVEFGTIAGDEFLTYEGDYSYFSPANYPNIEFSHSTGRIFSNFQDSNTLDIFKLQVEKKDTLYLTGTVYQTDLAKQPPLLLPYRDEPLRIFKRVAPLPKDPVIKFFEPPTDSKPVLIENFGINLESMQCNGCTIAFGQKVDLDFFKTQIGLYETFEEWPVRSIVIYPNMEFHLNTSDEFIGIGKKFNEGGYIEAFGFEFSNLLTSEDFEHTIKEKALQYKTEQLETSTYIDVDIEGIMVRGIFNNDTKKLSKVLILKLSLEKI